VNCWITGAHGFIGRHLARHLATSGWRVAGIGHGAWAASEAAQWGLDYWLNGEVGIGNLAQMERDCGIPEVVFHLAGGSSVGVALANPLEDFRRSVVSTSELLEWMRLNARGSRLVAASSAAVYGEAHAGPIAEEALVLPVSVYGAHKLMMEDLCRSYAGTYELNIVLPRLFSVYGCGLRKQLLWDLCEKLASGGPVELGGNGAELRDWVEVHDVVRALQQVVPIASAKAPSINVASGNGTAVRDVADMVARSWVGSGGKRPPLSFNGHTRLGDPFSLVADVRQMRMLNIAPEIPLMQGVAGYVAWYQALRRVS
jgi:UDP-glucose 4-epimerase